MISRVVKESSDSLFPGERRLISLQYSEMLSISLRFRCPSPDTFCTAFSHAKPPRNIHAAREVTFIPILKIIRDELPMEQGVYGGCLLCPLYPVLFSMHFFNFTQYALNKSCFCKAVRLAQTKTQHLRFLIPLTGVSMLVIC